MVSSDNIWTQKIYKIVNVKSGTNMSVSSDDNRKLVGFPGHDGPDQLFKFEPFGPRDSYFIRSLHEHSTGILGKKSPLYISFNVEHNTRHPLVLSEYPVCWKIEWMHASTVNREEGGIVKILLASGSHVFDLDQGRSQPGTLINLVKPKELEEAQMWRLVPTSHFLRKALPQDCEREENTVVTPVSETLVDVEHCNGDTVTVTKTITSVTTVTTTVRSPCQCST
ncbi:hypothetical protein C8Q75DRAFT_744125 [Abortiporus biennis]|nr:hypothetical protein C8Q75DRAFT_744125 [Abortiporus biennis]